jgi:hypothetical protein
VHAFFTHIDTVFHTTRIAGKHVFVFDTFSQTFFPSLLIPYRFRLAVASRLCYIVIINTGKHFSQIIITGGADGGFSRD